MSKRYTIREFGGARAIRDNRPDVVILLRPFGWGRVRTFDKHREIYSIDDAQAVCDWLNERETWPEFQQQDVKQ